MSKILIVDDDPHIRQLAAVFLKDEGYDIVQASDGLEALTKLETTKVDLVVLDIMMPNKDGWSVLTDLKSDPMTREYPVIICSIIFVSAQ